MVTLGGNEKQIGPKVCKIRRFYEIRGKFAKEGGIIIFPK